MIGVYDSGFGGLTVLRALQARLPERDFFFLGDAGRGPYGNREVDLVLDLAEQCVEYLFTHGCRVVVVGCHTVSSVALRHLQRRYAGADRRILGVTIPAAEAAVAESAGHIGLIGTARTVRSGTFALEVNKLGPHRVTQREAPLLAAIVEEGWEDTDVARAAVARYVVGLDDVDTLVLGCTHYPLLRPAFAAVLPAHVRLLDPAPVVADRLADWLDRHPGFDEPGTGHLVVASTGDPASFAAHGGRFLGRPLPEVEAVHEVNGRLAPGRRHAPIGQVVR